MDTPEDLKAWRKAQRAHLLDRRMAIAEDARRAWTQTITRFLIEGFACLEQAIVGYCWPYKGEPDPRFAIRHLRDRGARSALPVVVARQAPLEFREWWPGVATSPGVFDLPVPQGTETVTPGALLIPPIGYDAGGYRLGYGGGYFDRTLAAMSPQPLRIAVAFELSSIPTIHPQTYDIPMDFIVTERGIQRVGAEGMEVIGTERANALAIALARERAI